MTDAAVDPKIDKPYQRAVTFAVGRNVAEFVAGMVEGGLDRDEAIHLASEYVNAIIYSQAPHHCEVDED